MLVLLADGRVQTVSALADPRLLRAMATINDGEPLPVGERPSPSDADAEAVNLSAEALVSATRDENDADDPPLAPQFAPEPARKEIDLTAALQQPILLFDQPQDRRVAELLPTIAEMAGAPIRFDPAELGAAVDGLKMSVHLRLENTTIGDILENLLKPAGLAYRVERRHIQIVPRGESN
jgi:hypothetical protein